MQSITSNTNKRRVFNNILNIILFLLITICIPLFTLGKFSFKESNEIDGVVSNIYSFSYYADVTPSLYVVIPLVSVYLLFSVLLLVRLRKEIKINIFYVILFLLFVGVRCYSIFTFYNGSQTFNYIEPFNESSISITYSGFSLTDRIITFIYNFCFASYFLLIATFKPLIKNNKYFFHILFILIELVVLSMIIYSFIYEFDKVKNNFFALFSPDPNCKFDMSITSYTTYRNVFGFFLMFGYLFASFDFLHKENFFSLFLMVIFYLFSLILCSRTPLLLMTVASGLFLLLYPIFNFIKHKGYSILFIVTLICIILFFVITLYGFNDTFLNKYLFFIKNYMTVNARKDLGKVALTMMNNIYVFLCGYSKYPFISIFSQYNLLTPIDHNVLTTSHNSFYDVFIQYGVLGASILAIVLLVMLIRLIVVLFKEKKTINIAYIIAMGLLAVYSYLEPRFIFLEEGTCIFFILVIANYYTSSNKKYKKMTRMDILVKNL